MFKTITKNFIFNSSILYEGIFDKIINFVHKLNLGC